MNKPLTKITSTYSIAVIILALLCMASSGFAANGTWTNAPVSGIWTNVLNWNGNVVPGAINNTANNGTDTSVATFTNAVGTYGGAANPVIPDDATVVNGKARMMGKIIFDTATCGAYVFSSPSPYAAQTATTPETGVLSFCVPAAVNQAATNGMGMTASVTHPQNFLIPVQIRFPSSTAGTYGFTNDAVSSSATLFFNSIFLYPGATSRGVTYVFAGANTGTNTVASLSQSVNQTGFPSGVRKEGTGRWIFSGANTFTAGSPMNIFGGTLEVQNAAAFGSSTAVVVSNAVLQIDGVTLNASSLGLKNGGNIRMNGTASVNGVSLGTEPASSMTLSTTSGGDVMTVGALTGGIADGVVHVAGPGTVLFSADSTITNGAWSFDAGTAQVGSFNALGATAKTLAFGANSTAKLQLLNNSITSLSLTSNPTAGSPVVENGGGSPLTLTVNNAPANTFAGVLQDGVGGGSLALTKNGIGILTLSGANTYTGNTTINLGTVNVTGSLTGSAVTVASGGTLMGNSTISGPVDVQSGGSLAPGNSAVGTLTVSSLTLESGSIQNFEFNTVPTNDLVIVSSSGGLTINGGSINLYQEGSLTAFAAPGTYNLFKYNGPLTGAAGNLSVANQQAGFTYAFGTAGGYVTLTIGVSSGVLATWNTDANGNWTDATKWSSNPSIPHAAGDSATFGVGTALRTVTLNANETVSGISFTNANSFIITGGNTLTLDNGGSPTTVNALGGTANAIQTAVTLNDNVTTTVSGGKTLSLSGTVANGVNGGKAITVAGSGTLAISGNNTYGPAAGSVGTTLNGNGVTVQLGHSSALGAGDVNMTASGTLQANAAGLNVANNLAIASLVEATVDNNGNNLTLGGTISGNGNLTKTGNGILVLGGNNSYAGSTTVKAGALSISSDGNLGTPPFFETPNIVLNGGKLLATATLTVNQNRDVGIGPASGSTGTNALIDVASGQTLSIYGVIASAGNSGVNGLTVNSGAGNNGTVILNGINTFNGPTYIANGALQLANSLALQNSVLNYTNGTLLFDASITAATIADLVGTRNLALTNLNGAGVALTLGGDNNSVTYQGNFSDTGVTSGTGAIVKQGSGTLTLAGTNSLSGDIRATTGTIEIPTNGVTVAGSVTSSGSAAPLVQVTGGSVFATNATLCTGGSSGPGNMLVSSGLASFSGTININAGGSEVSVNCGLTVNTNASLYASNLTMGRGGLTATVQPGTGQAGQGLIVNGGTVVITNNINMGPTGANSSTSLSVNSGSLTVGGWLSFGCNNGGRWSVVDVDGGTLTVPDVVTGIRLGATTVGAGDVLLVRAGTVTAGIITLGNTNNVNTNLESTVVNVAGGSLYVGAGGIVQANTNAVPSVTLNSGILGATADWTYTNSMTLGTAAIQAADASGTPHNITLTGPIGGNALTKTGNGTLTLASVGNFYTNGVILNAGKLNINSIWQLGGGAYGGFTFNGGTLQYAAVPMNGALDITHDTSIDGTNGVVKIVTLSSNATIDVNGNSVTYSNSIGNGGNGGLIVQSSSPGGVLNLQGFNSYTGNTTVSSGTLELATNSIYLKSTVSVASGAVLQLDFSVTNSVTNLVLNGVQKVPGVYNSINSAPYITGPGSLMVASAVATNPTNITVSVSGSTLTLTWPTDHIGWTLQAQTNNASVGLSTNWVDVPTSGNSYSTTIDPTKPTVFYRMKN